MSLAPLPRDPEAAPDPSRPENQVHPYPGAEWAGYADPDAPGRAGYDYAPYQGPPCRCGADRPCGTLPGVYWETYAADSDGPDGYEGGPPTWPSTRGRELLTMLDLPVPNDTDRFDVVIEAPRDCKGEGETPVRHCTDVEECGGVWAENGDGPCPNCGAASVAAGHTLNDVAQLRGGTNG